MTILCGNTHYIAQCFTDGVSDREPVHGRFTTEHVDPDQGHRITPVQVSISVP
jgi:hypothetical protein